MPTVIDGTDGVNKVDFSEIATGTPSSSTFLRGDGAWAAVDVEGEIADFAAGEPGQPRLVGNAVSVFPNGYPILTVTSTPTYTLTNGRTIETLTTSTTNTNNPPTVAAARITVSQYTGSMRFTIAVQGGCINNASMTYRVALFKNNVLVQQVDTTGVDCDTFYISVNSTCTPSDIMEWRMSTSRSDRSINLFETFVAASNIYTPATLFRPAV